MKYNEGDKVCIKSKDWYDNNKDEYGSVRNIGKYGWVFTEHNSRFCGKVVTILLKGSASYAIIEDSCEGFWTDEMIECKVEEEASTKPEKLSTHSTFVETARGYLVEALSDLNVIDVSHMSDLEKSSLYCAKENIKDALNLMEE